jgi:hypothetical protein
VTSAGAGPKGICGPNDTAHHFAVVDADTTTLRLTTYGCRDAVGPVEPVDGVVIVA